MRQRKIDGTHWRSKAHGGIMRFREIKDGIVVLEALEPRRRWGRPAILQIETVASEEVLRNEWEEVAMLEGEWILVPSVDNMARGVWDPVAGEWKARS